jgi:hypothetical protein
MSENLFESLTAAEFVAFLGEIPVEKRTSSAFFLIGWLQADLTDEARGRAASELLRSDGAVIHLFPSLRPANGSSPLRP